MKSVTLELYQEETIKICISHHNENLTAIKLGKI